jgi:hypothetical protein
MNRRIRNAELEAQIAVLGRSLREDRDRWATQAERLALPAPGPTRRGWWPFRRAS